jgi:hypothetical protein
MQGCGPLKSAYVDKNSERGAKKPGRTVVVQPGFCGFIGGLLSPEFLLSWLQPAVAAFVPGDALTGVRVHDRSGFADPPAAAR